MKKLIFLLGLGCSLASYAQTPANTTDAKKPEVKKTAENPSTWGIKFGGFLRSDMYFDSRQVVAARPANQGELLLYPANKSLDANGKDINDAASFNMTSIASRLSGMVTGPDAFGAKTSGLLEAEFFGNANGNENVFRLRHAYAKLDWDKTQLAFGQYWHPLFVTDCFPGVISFNTGMPFQPFARNPQVRLTQKLNSSFNLILAMVSQTEAFVSPGSSTGIALGSSAAAQTFINDAVMPNLHAQLQYKTPALVAGVALDYKSLRPALKVASAPSASTYVATTENVNSTTLEAYAKITTKDVVIKGEYVRGQNMYDHLMMGGYLAYGAAPNITYSPIQVNSMWFEIAGTSKTLIPGLFVGYTNNEGSTDAGAAVASYARGIAANGASLDHILRVAPRLEFVSGKFKFGTELEITSAGYGTANTTGRVPTVNADVTNTRVLFVTTYSF
ncbi:MAG: hypothetical protein RLZ56_716 [Bacteroidota bacterium]|jgi:hypothetical protein